MAINQGRLLGYGKFVNYYFEYLEEITLISNFNQLAKFKLVGNKLLECIINNNIGFLENHKSNCRSLTCILREGHFEAVYFTHDNNIHID